MTKSELYLAFTRCFPGIDESKVIKTKALGRRVKNSVYIQMVAGDAYIFTYYDKKNWSLETEKYFKENRFDEKLRKDDDIYED